MPSPRRPQRLKIRFQQFHHERLIVRSTPAIAHDASDQYLTVVVDLDEWATAMRAVHCSSYSSVRMTKIFAPARWRIAGSVLSAPQCFYPYCPWGVRKDRDGRRIQAEANQRRLADSSKETAPSLCWSRVLSAHTHAHEVAENKCHDNPRKNIRTWHHASFAHQAPPAVHSFLACSVVHFRTSRKVVRQLSDVARDPSSLVHGEDVGDVGVSLVSRP